MNQSYCSLPLLAGCLRSKGAERRGRFAFLKLKLANKGICFLIEKIGILQQALTFAGLLLIVQRLFMAVNKLSQCLSNAVGSGIHRIEELISLACGANVVLQSSNI